jgi:Peptidase A4 family
MTDSDADQRKAGREIPAVPGVRLFAPSSKDFDPIKASDRELLVHGYPPRPDSSALPEVHVQWEEMMSRPMSLIQPQFAVLPEWLRARRETPPPTVRADVLPSSGDGWSGSAALPKDGDAFWFVMGQWTVPHVIPPGSNQDISGCANWVGIDGYNRAATAATSQIVQAGTTQVALSFFGFPPTRTFAWFEWWPEPPVTVSNLDVRPGDVVFCVICIDSQTEVRVYMGNLTTDVLTSFSKTAPDGLRVVGGSAEWILENPPNSGSGFPADPPTFGWLGPLPRFGPVYFDFCLAGTRDGAVHSPGTSTLLNMVNTDGHRIATPMALTDDVQRIRYVVP